MLVLKLIGIRKHKYLSNKLYAVVCETFLEYATQKSSCPDAMCMNLMTSVGGLWCNITVV